MCKHAEGMTMERILLEFEQVTGLSKKFRLENVNFALPAGYICGLMGSNGAGKTTLIRYIVEEGQKYSGIIRIDGTDIREKHGYIQNKIGFVSEDNSFFLEKTAKQNAEMLGIFYEEFDMDLFRKTMEEMELSIKKIYGNMSRGERLKFQMAFAMAHGSVIYLLDEVTVGMDPVFRVDFFKLLQKVISEERASVLMTSHIEAEMERKADYVGIMEQGRLIRFGESIDIIPGRSVRSTSKSAKGAD